MSESQKGNPTRCPTVYCLNSDRAFYVVEYTINDDVTGNWITGDKRLPRGAKVRIVNEGTQSRTVRVKTTSYQATVPAGSEAIIAPTDETVDAWQPELGEYEFELVGEDDAAPYAITVFHPGALDFNQSPVATAIHGGGCCRTSIAIKATQLWSGFLGNYGAYGKRYATRTITTEYFPFTSSGEAVIFAEINALGPYAFNGARRKQRERFRSKKWMIRAREEYVIERNIGGVYSPDNSGYIRYFEQYGARVEAHIPEGETEATETRAYFIEPGDENIISDQVKTLDLRWKYGQLDNEGVIQEPFTDAGSAGTITTELDNEYLIEEALGYLDAAMSTGKRWFNVEYPYTKAEASFVTINEESQTAAVTLNGCRLDNGAETQESIFDASGPTYTSDWLFGQGADFVWPPPTGAAWCDENLECGGLINSPIPPDYRCVFSDDGNSLNGLLPGNANSVDDPEAGITLSAEMFTLDHPSNPLRNPCATKQNKLNNNPEEADPSALAVISPPLHHLAEITFEAKEYGILITRTAVKHWWGAPFCRAVYEVKGESNAELIDCEAELEGLRYDSTAPCAWIDDPARRKTRIRADEEAGLTDYDAEVLDWVNQIQIGQTFTRVVEMTCPDMEQPENPCGCG